MRRPVAGPPASADVQRQAVVPAGPLQLPLQLQYLDLVDLGVAEHAVREDDLVVRQEQPLHGCVHQRSQPLEREDVAISFAVMYASASVGPSGVSSSARMTEAVPSMRYACPVALLARREVRGG